MSIEFWVRTSNERPWSTVPAEAGRYPAGDVLVRGWEALRAEDGHERFPGAVPVALVRDADPADIVALKVWADHLHALGYPEVEAVIPYLPGAREDRGAHFGARSYAALINSCGFSKVTCLDPHSDVVGALYNNLHVWSAASILERVASSWDGIVSPDAGASKRAWGVAERLKLPLYQALKHRDPATGKLSGFWCEPLPNGHYLVVDDICDAGGTFVGLVEAAGRPGVTFDLWVTHGVFTGGREAHTRLSGAFDRILTTDSFTGPVPLLATVVYNVRDITLFKAERLTTTTRRPTL